MGSEMCISDRINVDVSLMSGVQLLTVMVDIALYERILSVERSVYLKVTIMARMITIGQLSVLSWIVVPAEVTER